MSGLYIYETSRGFQRVDADFYPEGENEKRTRIVQASSHIGGYEDSYEKPGSSFLWIGDHAHLNREDVRQLVDILNNWLKEGKLF